MDPEEREKIQGMCIARVSEWRKRKKAFKELWDLITESLPKDLKEFKVSPHPKSILNLFSELLIRWHLASICSEVVAGI